MWPENENKDVLFHQPAIMQGGASMRQQIIEALKERYLEDTRVYALWLEGSDGLGRSDQYSDLDIWMDVEDGREEAILDECEELLSGLAPLDLTDHCHHPHPKIFQRNFHLAGTSPYLMVDLCIQSHSRGREGCIFMEGDVAEFPLILFDKAQVIAIIPAPDPHWREIGEVYHNLQNVFQQRSRAVKYIRRNQFIEASAYFDKYVRQPLLTMARLLYTPHHHEYGPVHISVHLPGELVTELERLYSIASIKDIENRMAVAERLHQDLCTQLDEMLSGKE